MWFFELEKMIDQNILNRNLSNWLIGLEKITNENIWNRKKNHEIATFSLIVKFLYFPNWILRNITILDNEHHIKSKCSAEVDMCPKNFTHMWQMKWPVYSQSSSKSYKWKNNFSLFI